MNSEKIFNGVLLIGVIASVAVIYRNMKSSKSKEEKSNFSSRRRRVFSPKTSANCYCANNDPNQGGYYGACPCSEGHHDVTPDESSSFRGAENPILSNYVKPTWSV